MPPQNRVGGDDRGDLPEPAPSQTPASHGQPASFTIGQPEAPSTQLSAEDPIFFDHIGTTATWFA